jgi:hypothetical protein
MTTPASGEISITDIVNELDYAILPTPIGLKADLYNTANTGGGTGLMYHNLNMATNNTTSAKNAIYDPLNANSNMTMTNWYNYTRDIDMVTTYTVTNNSANNLSLDVIIVDSSNNNMASVFNGQLAGGGGTSTGTASGPLTITGGITSGYRIRIENVDFIPAPNPPVPFPPAPGQTFSVSFTITSSDTDGVGASTTRTVNTPGTYTVVGGTPNPFTATNIVDTSGSPIPCNKRTTVTITLA